ncbi:hypothetical protein RYB01_23585 [Pseudomonas syringae]|nr:hypothetical protein [Pseudomonas syringae]
MRISHESNVNERLKWLDGVLDGSITPSSKQIEALRNLRSFIEMEIPNRFVKAAYNTLKVYATETRQPLTPRHHATTWDFIREQREAAYRKISSNSAVELTKKERQDIESQALLDAHICNMAYLELYQFLQSLTHEELDMPERLRVRIQNHLVTSSEKFRSLASFNRPEAQPLKLVKGGKK